MSSLTIVHGRTVEPPFAPVPPPPQPLTGEVGIASSDVASEWPDLPEVGQRFWSPHHFEVVPGTILLAHPATDYAGGGASHALFEVTGDVDDVFDAFIAQSPGTRDVDLRRSTWGRDGMRIRSVGWTDGMETTLRAYEVPGRPTILLVDSLSSD
jgi:hypothetical protein